MDLCCSSGSDNHDKCMSIDNYPGKAIYYKVPVIKVCKAKVCIPLYIAHVHKQQWRHLVQIHQNHQFFKKMMLLYLKVPWNIYVLKCLLQYVPVSAPKCIHKQVIVARILTSAEHLSLLKEKEDKKKKLEDKERRKWKRRIKKNQKAESKLKRKLPQLRTSPSTCTDINLEPTSSKSKIVSTYSKG